MFIDNAHTKSITSTFNQTTTITIVSYITSNIVMTNFMIIDMYITIATNNVCACIIYSTTTIIINVIANTTINILDAYVDKATRDVTTCVKVIIEKSVSSTIAIIDMCSVIDCVIVDMNSNINDAFIVYHQHGHY